jgi:hypothetical protein
MASMELHHSAAACRIEWQATMHRWKDTLHLWVWKANLVVSLARQMRYCEQSKMVSTRGFDQSWADIDA